MHPAFRAFKAPVLSAEKAAELRQNRTNDASPVISAFSRNSKSASLPTPKSLPTRKRGAKSYKERAGSDDDSDADDAATPSVKRPKSLGARPRMASMTMTPRLMHSAASEAGLASPPRPGGFKIPFRDMSLSETLDPNRNRTLGMLQRPHQRIARALHDPDNPDAIVLYLPPELSAEERIKAQAMLGLKGKSKEGEAKIEVAVVVDPILASVLRPHQVAGLRFLWECSTGRRVDGAYGCIMADEMGLGKTLQCIALLWTLLRQSPEPGKPEIEKCLIVCPSSLVRNWAKEIVKWLGPNRIHPLAVGEKGGKERVQTDIARFAAGCGRSNKTPVMVISYETLRSNAAMLTKTPIGLMLCDEGHRLKNAASQTFVALTALNVQRRVILSGTPIQNDLTEYFNLLTFANPNFLGTPAEFRRKYEGPISRGRDADASETERKLGDERLLELTQTANRFIIRRTNDILSKYLPVKYEHVVFCRLGDKQMSLYQEFARSPAVRRLLNDVENGRTGDGEKLMPLKAITMLKKLCNDPRLLQSASDFPGLNFKLTPEWANDPRFRMLEGKMIVLDRMLARIKAAGEKVVLISNYTQTLDLFERLCAARQFASLRLDGTMTISKRQQLVDKFNDPEVPAFIFLLSSKAGGCGLNLIGANRLILFDPDWNPAADQQALARVWRDGQGKSCFIYRFIGTGTIEEKIFQRQTHKQSLSSCVVDALEDVERHFSLLDMRKLFKLNDTTNCETHDTFKCRRCVAGIQTRQGDMNYGDASTWNHFGPNELSKLFDPVLRDCIKGVGSFVFQYKSHEERRPPPVRVIPEPAEDLSEEEAN